MAKRKKKSPESLDFLEENSLSSKALDEIMHYVNALDSAQAKVERLEGEIEEAKKAVDNIAKKILPEMLLSAGFETLGLANGKKIEIKEEVYVNVPKDPFKKRILFNWMKQQGAEYLIRKELKVDDPSEELMNDLSSQGVSYDKSENVNVNSFKAFIREGLGLKKGSVATFSKEDVPSECNLFINREAKVSG